MASFGVLPNYVEPCLSEKQNSFDSNWLNASEFGEFYTSQSVSSFYPRLTPVYNGRILGIQPELVHESLSGISIKHYYGKCLNLEEDENILYGDQTEIYDYEWVDEMPEKIMNSTTSSKDCSDDVTESGSFEYRESLHEEGQPLCTLSKISCRNSFWNIHRPEMCKLTWGQKYVSAATVIDHLHEHLVHHGPLCRAFHTEEDRDFMLNKELDEYVRLKVLLCPKELPPEEPLFNFKQTIKPSKRNVHPSCKTRLLPEITEPINDNERYFELSDDEDTIEKSIHRSKEEFCVTIGKPIRKPTLLSSTLLLPEAYITPEIGYGEEEEDFRFYYDWFLYTGEEYFDKYSDKTESIGSSTLSGVDIDSKLGKPMGLDEFCRGMGNKVDYSDVQCKPDF